MEVKGITLHEGYNDLGTFEADITDIKDPINLVSQQLINSQPISTSLLLRLLFVTTDIPIPTDFKVVLKAKDPVLNDFIEYTSNTDSGGYIQIDTPLWPTVLISLNDENTIHYLINGPLNERAQECYLKVLSAANEVLYTLITDFVIHNGYLSVTDGNGNYYKVQSPEIAINPNTASAINISKYGGVSVFLTGTNTWSYIDQLSFNFIEHPENLVSVSDGFYHAGSDVGTITTGNLGDAAPSLFTDYSGNVINSQAFKTDLEVDVYYPNEVNPFYTETLNNLIQGSLNFTIVHVVGSVPATPDNSPTLNEIETISGVTFSVAFRDFLTGRNLTTTEKIRKAGPITYIEGFPSADVGAQELATLQGHIDLSIMNQDIVQNQHIMDSGYGNLFKIASSSKNKFLDDVVDVDLPLFRAAQIHEVAVQNQKLVSNLLAGALSDARMVNSVIPDVSGSTFRAVALAKATNSCGCDDCQSNISPFAYLMDLIKYGAEHIDHNATPLFDHYGDDLGDFIYVLETVFLQPFGTLNVDCHTLHDEYCRVRLVTEVLEKLVAKNILGAIVPPSPTQITTLTAQRNQYLTLVYKNILTRSGTSINEIRDLVVMPAGAAKTKAAQKIADKLGVLLYVPSTTDYTAEAIWLTLGNLNPSHDLTQNNIEALFGYRSTLRNVLTNTPVSYMEQWHKLYLRDVWKKQDYLFSDYSREDANPSNLATIKSNWKPIVDPDNMGWEDMTYLENTIAKSLYLNRKADTDRILDFYVNDSSVVSETSVDETALIVKVEGKDVSTHVFEDNKIYLQNPSGPTWTPLIVYGKSVKGLNTDIVLSALLPPPPLFQPYTTSLIPPTMRYRRVLNVTSIIISITPTITATLTWVDPLLVDYLTSGYAKLGSDGSTANSPFETTGIGAQQITGVTFVGNTQVILDLASAPNASFISGNKTFVYEVEVPIVTDKIINPELLSTYVFATQENYTFLTPSILFPALTYPYYAWSTVTWPGNINASFTPFGKLKQMQDLLAAGTTVSVFTSIINNNLHMNLSAFNRFMQLMRACEGYLAAMFTQKRPTLQELYELASILRECGKAQMRMMWVREEIQYPISSSQNLALNGKFFWKALKEPTNGTWDSSLQTIPVVVGDIDYSKDIPIIDPELISLSDILDTPESKPYRDLYVARQISLEGTIAYLNGFLPYNNSFTFMLNLVNTGNALSPYSILPYTSLSDLLDDLQSNNPFINKKASDVVWNSFAILSDDFIEILKVKNLYESIDASLKPSNSELQQVIKLLVSGYKRHFVYRTHGASVGWIEEEIAGGPSLSSGFPVKYYNVLKMKLAPGRTYSDNRIEWQNTLSAWNKQPIIQPDIVPPEDIINISTTNWPYNTWSSRKTSLIADYLNLLSILNQPTNLTVFTALQDEINIIIGRVNNYTPLGTYHYLPFFTNLKVKEANGEDIRPYLQQLGITITEYRYLLKIYEMFEALSVSSPTGTPPWLDEEQQDVTNILIAINSRNITFTQVKAEYDNNIILSPDYFKIYKPVLTNFPLTNLPQPNPWRFSRRQLKNWEDTLQGRIDREKAVADEWKENLKDVEDDNMPLMRDALIKALTPNCVSWQDTAEKIARSFFIETKDNCCVKHTRVSFAIETMQGLFFALHNGIYDDFITNFSLYAPNFNTEWQWIGSYSTWRSAMFVFLYPENLLYPSLKRLQSPAFIKLSQNLQSANSFSPEDACAAAKDFEKYLNDIENLTIICSTSARCMYKPKPLNECCAEPDILKWETYMFGQSPSGTPYWAIKQSEEWDGMGFWQELPIEGESLKLLGCSTYGTRWDGWKEYPLALFLFFSYKDKGKLKIAYIKRELLKPDSGWTAQKDCEDLPTIDGEVEPSFITLAQQSEDWEVPCFVFSYHKTVTIYKNIVIHHPWAHWAIPAPSNWQNGLTIPTAEILNQTTRIHLPFSYNIIGDKFIPNQYKVLNNSDKPEVAIRHLLPSKWFFALSLVFPPTADTTLELNSFGCVNIGVLGFEKTLKWIPGSTSGNSMPKIKKIIGGFDSRYDLVNNSITIHYNSQASGNPYTVIKLDINANSLENYINTTTSSTAGIIVPTQITSNIQTTNVKIYPFFQERDAPRLYAVKDNTDMFFGVKILDASTTANYCALKPEKIADISIDSAECIKDMAIRKLSIQNILKKNMNSPQGTSSGWKKRPQTVKELLFEAYYYVPMLLALDQQKRGQFDSALSWYRSVYDYTNNLIVNRKIFYGLVMEETIANSYTQSANWLLDPLNPHLIAQTRANAYTKYTIMNIIQCLYGYADREFTMDTIETVPIARKLYSVALDLLKIEELLVKDNTCLSLANTCLRTEASGVSAMPEHTNMMDRLIGGIAKIGDPSTIDLVSSQIADLLNEATEETFPEKFAASFVLIEDNTPPDPTPENIATVVGKTAEQTNNAYRYLLATEDQQSFKTQVEDMYATTVAGISGISKSAVNDPSNVQQLSWLYEPAPKSNQPTKFDFATPNGLQLLPLTPYNPTRPEPVAFLSAALYVNIPFVIGAYQTGMPAVYSPLMGYHFCMPKNPIYQALGLKGNLELYKIFNCRNIAGMVRELEVYAAATDSVTGIPIIGAEGNLVTPAIGNYASSQYRFRTLIERAKQIAAQAQQMESMFLAALEKEDAENYSQMKARQDLETARATVKLQDLRITQANNEKVIADLQLDKATFVRDHYQQLFDSGLNAYEISSLVLLQTAAIMQLTVGTSASITAIGAALDPRSNAADVLSATLNALSSVSQGLTTQSSILSQLASFQRRQEEWGFQKDVANFDISISNQQIKVAGDNIRIVTQERQIAQINVNQAQDSLTFLKTKFTNAELYNFMGNVLEKSYSYMLNLSTSIARTAERQLYFERQQQAGPFILDDYWETPSSGFTSGSSGSAVDRRGLTGSARLLVDITKLDQYAFDTNKRKLQMTKVISLAQNFPAEFQEFRETGVFNFSLTNQLFDYDFPGQYLRLINSVKTTVVGLLPVYDQIKAKLTADTISYAVIGGTTFQKIPIRRLELDSVALTSANNATGIFEMQPMQSEFLNPFEGMGLESRWEFKMPQFSNRIDYSNIADVLLTVEYTALESYQYQYQVLQDLQNELTFSRGFSFKNNFPDQWYELAEVQSGPPTFSVTVQLKREMFPQGIENLELNNGNAIVLYFVRADDFNKEITVYDFNLSSVVETDHEVSTLNGKLTSTSVLMNSIPANSSPVINIRLSFANTVENRALFSEENVKDILMIVPCKAELKNYPL